MREHWIKVEIRTDRDAGMVSAVFVGPDRERVTIATLARSLADFPAVFTAWKETVKLALSTVLAEHGIEHGGPIEIQPNSMN